MATNSNWEEFQAEAKKHYDDEKFRSALELYTSALIELRKEEEYKRNDAAIILSKISLMYFKLFQIEKDEDYIDEAKNNAQDSIFESPLLHDGYVRLADCYKVENEINSLLDTLKSYLDTINNDSSEIPNEVQRYMISVRYFTHKHVIMSMEIWGDIKYPDNFVVVDPNGAGHFIDLAGLFKSKLSLRNLTVIVQPGVYEGHYEILNSNVQILGNSRPKKFRANKAIKEEPSVVFINSIYPFQPNEYLKKILSHEVKAVNPHTFAILNSNVTISNVCIKDNVQFCPVHALTIENSTVNIFASSLISNCSPTIRFGKSIVNLEGCMSVKAYSLVHSTNDSTCTLKNCYIAKANVMALEFAKNTKYIVIKNTVVEDCRREALGVLNISDGKTVIKIKGSKFLNNALDVPLEHGSVNLIDCKSYLKNTIVEGEKAVAITQQKGYARYENLELRNCLCGILIQGDCYVKDCLFDECFSAMNICQQEYKGPVEMENNTLKNCMLPINRTWPVMEIVFHGNRRHPICFLDDDSPMVVVKENSKEHRMLEEFHAKYNHIDGKGVYRMHHNTKEIAQKTCNFCGDTETKSKKVFQYCGRCKRAMYCSIDCQKKAWKNHKPLCDMSLDDKPERKIREINDDEEVTTLKSESNDNDENSKHDNAAAAQPTWKKKNKKKKKKKATF